MSSPLSAHLVAYSLTIFMLILKALATKITKVAIIIVATADIMAAPLYRLLPYRSIYSYYAADAVLNLDSSDSYTAIIYRLNKK